MAQRKRNDIDDDAPIDGDYTKDVVLNKDPAKAYFLVSKDDLPVLRGRGAVRTERTEDGAHPVFDTGETGGYEVGGQLTLMEMSAERAAKIQARGEREFNRQMQSERDALSQTTYAGPDGRYGSLGPSPGQRPRFDVTT